MQAFLFVARVIMLKKRIAYLHLLVQIKAGRILRYITVVFHVCIAQGSKTSRHGGQKESDDNPDKLVRVMKTEPCVWLNKHREAQISERTREGEVERKEETETQG